MSPGAGQKPPVGKRSSQEDKDGKRRLDGVRKRTRGRRSVVENAEKK